MIDTSRNKNLLKVEKAQYEALEEDKRRTAKMQQAEYEAYLENDKRKAEYQKAEYEAYLENDKRKAEYDKAYYEAKVDDVKRTQSITDKYNQTLQRAIKFIDAGPAKVKDKGVYTQIDTLVKQTQKDGFQPDLATMQEYTAQLKQLMRVAGKNGNIATLQRLLESVNKDLTNSAMGKSLRERFGRLTRRNKLCGKRCSKG